MYQDNLVKEQVVWGWTLGNGIQFCIESGMTGNKGTFAIFIAHPLLSFAQPSP